MRRRSAITCRHYGHQLTGTRDLGFGTMSQPVRLLLGVGAEPAVHGACLRHATTSACRCVNSGCF